MLSTTGSWIESLGVQIQNTRFAAYQRSLTDLVGSYKTAPNAELKAREREYFNALFEAHEFVELYERLRRLNPDQVASRLPVVVSGPPDRRDEDPSKATNDPRNKMFELLAAGWFARAGMTPQFDDGGDFFFDLAGARIYCECKRPYSERRAHRNTSRPVLRLGRRVHVQHGADLRSAYRRRFTHSKHFSAKIDLSLPCRGMLW